MSFIETLATSNMPAAIAFVAVILLLGAYIIFVVPMIKGNDTMKKQRAEHDEEVKAILEELKQLVVDKTALEESFFQFARAQNDEHKILVGMMERIFGDTQRILDELMTREEVEAFISYLQNNANVAHHETMQKVAQIVEILHSIKQVSDDIKDKQSTMNGALFLSSTRTGKGLK